jgi:hypothetical protein
MTHINWVLDNANCWKAPVPLLCEEVQHLRDLLRVARTMIPPESVLAGNIAVALGEKEE